MASHTVINALVDKGLSFPKAHWKKAEQYLPYAICQPNGRADFILLNRNYKPLGVADSSRVDYDSPDFDYCRIEGQLQGVSLHPGPEGGFLWFYNDSTAPHLSHTFMAMYLRKLCKTLVCIEHGVLMNE